MRSVRAADLFCGAGGTSTGLVRACEKIGKRLDLTAVNHWPVAVETHAANHPAANHLCESLDSVDPRKAVNGRLDLLIASPECTHHSIARGGKPINDQSRATAWHVVRWAEALRPRYILVENVREFQTWGPIGENGRPLKRHRGATFQSWVQALKSLGYSVEWRVLNAANYGDATARERLFVLARIGRGDVPWPNPTHSRDGQTNLFRSQSSWRPARDIIDWSLRGDSIFNRKRPLSPNTMARIEAGLRKFGGSAFTPHTTHRGGDRVNGLGKPLPTVTGANRGEQALIRPFLVQAGGPAGKARNPQSVDDPLRTIITENHTALVQPFLVNLRGTEESRLRSSAKPVDEPLLAITSGGRHLVVVEPFLISAGGPCVDAIPVSRPMNTVLTRDHMAIVEPFLVKHNGTASGGFSVDEPLDTITAKDRFGLAETCRSVGIDILFRMLAPHELAAAHSFPKNYRFAGNRGDQVKQIGNSVPCGIAEALCEALLSN